MFRFHNLFRKEAVAIPVMLSHLLWLYQLSASIQLWRYQLGSAPGETRSVVYNSDNPHQAKPTKTTPAWCVDKCDGSSDETDNDKNDDGNDSIKTATTLMISFHNSAKRFWNVCHMLEIKPHARGPTCTGYCGIHSPPRTHENDINIKSKCWRYEAQKSCITVLFLPCWNKFKIQDQIAAYILSKILELDRWFAEFRIETRANYFTPLNV